ncbi:MAG: hypothetical protein JWP37_3777 [Mucilaginibacter sp.]|nr:hypothetical protein [Mucilaginibacter sp.]
MSVRYSRYLPAAVLIADLVLLNLALIISIYITYGIYPIGSGFQFGVITNLFWVFISILNKSYIIPRPLDLKTYLSRLLLTLTYYLVGVLGCIWVFQLNQIPRPTFIAFYLSYLCFLIAGRGILFFLLDNLRKRGYNHRQVLVVGDKSLFARIDGLFKSHPEYGYDILDFIGIEEILSLPENLRDFKLLNGNPDEIFICYKELDERLLKILTRFGNTFSIKIKVISDNILEQQFEHILNYNNLKVLHVTSQPKVSYKMQILKRAFDIGFSALVMSIGAPVFLIIYIITKFSSKGPVFYKQERVGKNNRPFNIYKFRSMHVDAEKFGPCLSSADDPRITKWGRVIRRTRMDELPQFWNVLKGDMSVVGHRPERQYFIEQIVEKNPCYKHLFKMKPGITSIGQVHYGYAENVDEMCDRLRYDLLYHQNISLNHDLNIILQTIKVMVQSKGK